MKLIANLLLKPLTLTLLCNTSAKAYLSKQKSLKEKQKVARIISSNIIE